MVWILPNYQFSQFWYWNREIFFLIALWSDTKFAPFRLKSLCFTQGMRKQRSYSGTQWGWITLRVFYSWRKRNVVAIIPKFVGVQNIFSWEENIMVKFSWNILRLNFLLLCHGLTHCHQIQSLSRRKTISGKCWLYFQPAKHAMNQL